MKTNRFILFLSLLFSFSAFADNYYLKADRPGKDKAYFGFGPAVFESVEGFGFYGTLGYSFDAGRAAIRVRSDVSVRKDNYWVEAGLGVNYYLSDSATAPFIGMDFSYAVVRFSDTNETPHGFVPAGIIGLQLLRTRSLTMEMALRYGVLLERTSRGYPGLWGFRVGLYF